jgi:rhodanese-related sulfurtransferase
MAFEQGGVNQVSVDELKELLKDGKTQVIDVRTEEEYREGHIPNIPLRTMQELPEWVEDLNPAESYVFVCRSGSRSQKVAMYLKHNGFDKVANYNGGMLVWDGDVVTD